LYKEALLRLNQSEREKIHKILFPSFNKKEEKINADRFSLSSLVKNPNASLYCN